LSCLPVAGDWERGIESWELGTGSWELLPIDNVVICSAVVVVVVAAACFTSWMGLGLWTRNSGTPELQHSVANPTVRGQTF